MFDGDDGDDVWDVGGWCCFGICERLVKGGGMEVKGW